MSESGFNLPKSVASNMVSEMFIGETKNIKSVYNTYVTNSKSLRE